MRSLRGFSAAGGRHWRWRDLGLGSRIPYLRRAFAASAERADQLHPLFLGGLVSTNRQPGETRLLPGLPSKRLGAGHRYFGPVARARDFNQTIDDLGVLARGREFAAAIPERLMTVREVEAVPVLDEAVPHLLWHRPGIGLGPL